MTKPPAPAPSSPAMRDPRRIIAVLGPTNTGKTHLALDRMMAHATGMIGLPLRLLAREIYDRVSRIKGENAVALITGEEKILPAAARYFICTVEAMPLDREVDFLAVDEIQLAADRERGHTFTDRLLRARGLSETMMLGSETVRGLIQKLLPDTVFVNRPRFSELTWTGSKKLTRLPRRSAIVAFSADQVYAIAELIRRQRGGAAVVMGALSPRTRNAQVALYQSGDVDFIVATDAIGMGLNMDVDHVAFASTSKFDGYQHRPLKAAELAQIAGRAGRHMNNGTFGITGDAAMLGDDIIERIENHTFDAEHLLQWRNPHPEFSSLSALIRSLELPPGRPGLTRAGMADDLEALTRMSQDEEIARIACNPAAIKRLWDVAQVPDFRKTMASEHAALLSRLYLFLMQDIGKIPEDWLSRQIDRLDRTDGEIDTLAVRLAHMRTWTYVSNRSDWIPNAAHWQKRTREVEDKVSDAFHERLTQRFVDRRTSVLMKRLRQKEDLMAAVSGDGEVLVEGEYVGRLQGFVFMPDVKAEGVHGNVLRAASEPVIALEIAARAARLAAAPDTEISLSEHGRLIWEGSPVAQLKASDVPLNPRIEMIAGEELNGALRENAVARLEAWTKMHVASVLAPLAALRDAEDIAGLARGIAFQLVENLGSLRREKIAEEVRSLDQAARGQLRKYGVRFGSYSIFMPALLKPAPARLLLTLWALNRKDVEDPFAELPQLPAAGLTSVVADVNAPEGFYEALGFRVYGGRAVRIDMLERIADLIRPVIAARDYKGGFIVTPAMMSLVGCSAEEFANLLRGLGYRSRTESLVPPKPPVEKQIAPTIPVVIINNRQAASADTSTDISEAAPEASQATSEGPSPETVAEAVVEEDRLDAAIEPVEDASETTESTPGDESAIEPVAAEQAAVAEDTAPTQNDEADTGAKTEDALVEFEVWRPARAQKPREQRARHGRRHNASAKSAEAGATAGSAPGEENQPSQRQGRRDHGGRNEKQDGKPAGQGQGLSEGGGQKFRPNRDKSGKRRNDEASGNSDEARRGNRHGSRRDGPRHDGPRHGPKNGKDGGRGAERRDFGPKPRREREPDPDSPFAILKDLVRDK